MTPHTFTLKVESEGLTPEAVQLIVSAILQAGLKTSRVGVRFVEVKLPRTRKSK